LQDWSTCVEMLENVAQRKAKLPGWAAQDVRARSRVYPTTTLHGRRRRARGFQELIRMLQQQVSAITSGRTAARSEHHSRDLARDAPGCASQPDARQPRSGEQPNQEFMDKYGDFFPPGISLQPGRLMEMMQRSMAQDAIVKPEHVARPAPSATADDGPAAGDDRLHASTWPVLASQPGTA